MNFDHRAIFLARLELTAYCEQAFGSEPLAVESTSIVEEKEAALGLINGLVANGIEGRRLDETIDGIFNRAGSGNLQTHSSERIRDLCFRCANRQQSESGLFHICDGRNYDKDRTALEIGGLCLSVLYDIFSIAGKLSGSIYAAHKANICNKKSTRFLPVGRRIGTFGSSYASEVPHNFGDHPAIVAANGMTAPPRSTEEPYKVELQISVDKFYSSQCAQLLLILHHEFFCHVYQHYSRKENWPPKLDIFTEGFMNCAGYRALMLTSEALSTSELAQMYTVDHGELRSRISLFHEAREASADGALLRFGTTTFQIMEGLMERAFPTQGQVCAVGLAAILNSADLTAEERNVLIRDFRQAATHFEGREGSQHDEDFNEAAIDTVTELLVKLLGNGDVIEFRANLVEFLDHAA